MCGKVGKSLGNEGRRSREVGENKGARRQFKWEIRGGKGGRKRWGIMVGKVGKVIGNEEREIS